MIKVDVLVVPVRRASLGLVAVSVWVQDVRGVYLALVLTLVIAVHAVRRRRVDGDIFESPLNRMPSHDEDAGQLLRPEAGWERLLDVLTSTLLISGMASGLLLGWALTHRVAGAVGGAAIAAATLLVVGSAGLHRGSHVDAGCPDTTNRLMAASSRAL